MKTPSFLPLLINWEPHPNIDNLVEFNEDDYVDDCYRMWFRKGVKESSPCYLEMIVQSSIIEKHYERESVELNPTANTGYIADWDETWNYLPPEEVSKTAKKLYRAFEKYLEAQVKKTIPKKELKFWTSILETLHECRGVYWSPDCFLYCDNGRWTFDT